MGLEIVELIMEVEEAFGLEIPDSEAQLLATPGALCALIERKLAILQAEKASRCPTSRAFYVVRHELIHLGVERAHITPRTSLESLWPSLDRRRNWDVLGESLNISLPPLQRSSAWDLVDLLPLSALSLLLWFPPLTALALFVLGYALYSSLALHAARSFTTHPPQGARTIADLSRLLAPHFYDQKPPQNPDVWPRVQLAVAQIAYVSLDEIKPESDFYRDLGIG